MMAQGEPMVWFTGGTLAVSLAMIVGLLCWVIYNGSVTFWPKPIYKVRLNDGQYVMGEIFSEEDYTLREDMLSTLSESDQQSAKELLASPNLSLIHI